MSLMPRTLLISLAAALAACTTEEPKSLQLAAKPATADGLHQVVGAEDYTLYVSPAFAEKGRTGGFEGTGLYIRSCTVTFADAEQEALFSELRDRMRDHLCESVRERLEERGAPLLEEQDVVADSRIIDLWLLHVSIKLPDVASTSATTFVYEGASEEMTLGWVSTEAGSGLPILRYYQRGHFGHRGLYTGSGHRPAWKDIEREIDELAERQRHQLDELLRRLAGYGDRVTIRASEKVLTRVAIDSSVFHLVLEESLPLSLSAREAGAL